MSSSSSKSLQNDSKRWKSIASSSRILVLPIHSSMDLTVTTAMTSLDGLPSCQQQPKPTTTAANQHDATPNYLRQFSNQIHNKNTALSIHSSMDSTGTTTTATMSLDGHPSFHGRPKPTATAANQGCSNPKWAGKGN